VSCHAREEEKPKEDDKEKENGKRSGAVDAQPPAKRQRAEAEEPPAPKTGLAPAEGDHFFPAFLTRGVCGVQAPLLPPRRCSTSCTR
jgi:hypothetical protein